MVSGVEQWLIRLETADESRARLTLRQWTNVPFLRASGNLIRSASRALQCGGEDMGIMHARKCCMLQFKFLSSMQMTALTGDDQSACGSNR